MYGGGAAGRKTLHGGSGAGRGVSRRRMASVSHIVSRRVKVVMAEAWGVLGELCSLLH